MHMGKSLTYQPRNLQPQWKLGQDKMFPGFSSPSRSYSESAGFSVCLRITPGQAAAAAGLNSARCRGRAARPGTARRSLPAVPEPSPGASARAGGNLRHGRGSSRAERPGRCPWGWDLWPRGALGTSILPWHAGAGRGSPADEQVSTFEIPPGKRFPGNSPIQVQ